MPAGVRSFSRALEVINSVSDTAPALSRRQIAAVVATIVLILVASWVLRHPLRAVAPGYLVLLGLGLLACAGALGRWRLRLDWPFVGQLVAVLLIVEVAMLAWIFVDLVEQFEGPVVLVAFLVALIGASTVILPAPTALTIIALGSSLNDPLAVGLAAAAGQTLGEGVGYLLGRSSAALLADSGCWIRRVSRVMRSSPWLADAIIVGFAAVPNPFFDVIGIIAGTVRYPFWRYGLAAYAGNAFKYTVIWGGLGTLLI